jgi:5-methylcytosine-specific restriction protein A
MITMLCSKRGCREKVPCQAHGVRNSTRSGYTYRWQQFRLAYLREHPLCAGPWSLCAKAGRVTPATDVDHDQRATGPDDPTFFEGPFNSLCRPCHAVKTREEERA